VDGYLADTRPGAYERLVDRLLSSPHFGERWGRHWLDWSGYADTVGGDNDTGQVFLRDGLWRYRDYVVRSLNEDRPHDRFLVEQLAGDELDDWRSAPRLTPAMQEHLVATGFLRTAVDSTTEAELNRLFERYQVLHDTIENVTSNLLGLTAGCARCHDHKFDPIPQVEYYRLLACLKPAYNPEAWIQPQNRHLEGSPREVEEINRHNADIDRQVADLNRRMADLRRPVEARLLEAKLATIPEVLRADLRTALATEAGKRSEVQKYLAGKLGPLVQVKPEEVTGALNDGERAQTAALAGQVASLNGQRRSPVKIQALWEPGQGSPPPTYVLRRGSHLTPGAEVQPGLFAVLTDPGKPILIPAVPPSPFPSPPGGEGRVRGSSGRRLALARWLTRPDHPLTARVFVNRVWQQHFGEGIVTTSDNFGHLGARPTHPELLDWLAVEFVQSGWQVKALHRLLVTSTAYRQASARGGVLAPGQSNQEMIDPGNQLLWRMRLRRVESEVVRDSVLAVSGTLNRTAGGPPVPIEAQTDGRVTVSAKAPPGAAYRRSIYLMTRRNYNISLLGVFDQPVMATNCTRRIVSAVPLQSLTLLNDAFMLEQADHFAGRVASAAGEDQGKQIEMAFRLAFARRPGAKETAAAVALLESVERRYAEEKMPPEQSRRKALAKLCHLLLCANEFLYAG
jgi:hypothetical protein